MQLRKPGRQPQGLPQQEQRLYLQKPTSQEDIGRAQQSKPLPAKTQNFLFPEKPARFSSRNWGCSRDVLLSSCKGQWSDLQLGATSNDRGPHQQCSGAPLRRGCVVSRSCFTDEETEPECDPNLLTDSLVTRVYFSFKRWLPPGISMNLSICAF